MTRPTFHLRFIDLICRAYLLLVGMHLSVPQVNSCGAIYSSPDYHTNFLSIWYCFYAYYTTRLTLPSALYRPVDGQSYIYESPIISLVGQYIYTCHVQSCGVLYSSPDCHTKNVLVSVCILDLDVSARQYYAEPSIRHQICYILSSTVTEQ